MDHIKGAIHGEHGGDKQQAAPAPAPAPQQPAPAPQQEEHHHGKDAAKKLGNATIFGAGATMGADAVKGAMGL